MRVPSARCFWCVLLAPLFWVLREGARAPCRRDFRRATGSCFPVLGGVI